jgi:hydroxyacylglutathione hydrolase
MHITPVPCLRDNYAYLAWGDGADGALVVDPSEAAPVVRALEAAGRKLVAVLNTHHHWDHVGGNSELVKRYGPIPVFGHASDKGRIAEQSEFLETGSEFDVAGLHFRALHIPGHTLGAVAYVTDRAVFTGDTLFVAGCGRLFEGTPEQMYTSLNVTLGALADDTRVFCGHEYTAKNLEFALHVEPGNADARAKAERVAGLRERGEPSVPSTLGDERRTNPFMRCDSAEIIKSVADRLGADRGPAAVLAAVRAAKDAY